MGQTRASGVVWGSLVWGGWAAALVVPVAAAAAQPIAVTNYTFDTPTVSPGGFTNAPPPGWSVVIAGGTVGVFYPTVPSWGYVSSHGNQLLYLNGATVQHETAAAAQPGGYTLRVDVIARPGFYQPGYTIRLLAGDMVLASDLGTVNPLSGGFLTRTLSVHIPSGSPAVGMPLRIRLGGPTQTNFDNVRLERGCYANCDASVTVPVLNVADFTCFLQRYAAADPYANCDNSTALPVLNVADFTCFLQRFASGCP